ncbi:putative cytokinesis regulator [Erysiphe neolycopersici]|uniref:Putative cytokinesis regulator n=1 Tax=Erysiphe neolycopersici TaxID=212602 RepID=A0A420I6M8_9PEZI|nr:putative cytokinesis regulator [Erysiphe neolycopersici]
MDQSKLKLQKEIVMEVIENWDDDDLDIGGDDFAFRSVSLATSVTTTLSNRRESMSSHMSVRSDIDSNNGDEERQVDVLGDDERSTNDAIATANLAGIPIPHNTPSSALIGGTIKRLGGRKITKNIQDDWDDGDLELSGESELKVKIYDDASFPESLRQFSGPSSTQSSPARQRKSALSSSYGPHLRLRSSQALNTLLDQYTDSENKEYTRENVISVSKHRKNTRLLPIVTSPTLYRRQQALEFEDFEQDFQLPLNDGPLRLSIKKDIPKTPSSIQDESDEWGEGGSLGTRHGGKRDRASNRDSSVTAMSPSVSSSLTLESEDEGLEGLLIPSDPIHFREILNKKRGQNASHNTEEIIPTSESKDDFFSGLDIGFGDIFDSRKHKMNRNVMVKTTRQASPTRPKAAVSLTFTSRSTTSSTSRLPRPLGTYERIPSSLESVPESGGPILNQSHRFHSRLGHSSHPSTSSTFTPSTPSSGIIPPSTPRRRELVSKTSLNTLHQETTTTSAQLLKVKRSMPIIRSFQTNSKPSTNPRFERPPLYFDNNRPFSFSRPKTPVERVRGTESSQSSNKLYQTPFLPAGASNAQSHHILAKHPHNLRHHNFESSSNNSERHLSSRTVSRSVISSSSPHQKGADALAREATTKRLLTRPVRGRHFGDGCELDAFDDLPTSRESEQKYIKEPVTRGPHRPNLCKKNVVDQDTRAFCNHISTSLTAKQSRDNLPRFARDTTASRLARENTIAQRISSSKGAPSATLTNHWIAKVNASTGLSSCKVRLTKPKKNKRIPQKPQLIKPLGNCNNPKCKFFPYSNLTGFYSFQPAIKGMYYNPHIYRWEGNESDLSQFDQLSSPSTSSIPSIAHRENRQNYREKETLTPRPALIQHVKSIHNVQVVGGMVFDPQRMCWLKISAQRRRDINSPDDITNSLDSFDDEEEDVFKDVPDLEDSRPCDSSSGGLNNDSYREDFLVGEEFDVGPEFIKRQREEEERWRRKVEKWIQAEFDIDRNNLDCRWTIRNMIMYHEL